MGTPEDQANASASASAAHTSRERDGGHGAELGRASESERMSPSTRRQLRFIAAVLVIGWIAGIALQIAGI